MNRKHQHWVTLEATEQDACHLVARNRKRDTLLKTGMSDNMSMCADGITSEKKNLDGFGAEMTVAKHFRRWPDFKTDYDILPEVDLTLGLGLNADVKSTRLTYGRLLVPVDSICPQVQIFILVLGEFPTYCITGFQFTAFIIQQAIDRVRADGPLNYIVPQKLLEPVSKLEQLATQSPW